MNEFDELMGAEDWYFDPIEELNQLDMEMLEELEMVQDLIGRVYSE